MPRAAIDIGSNSILLTIVDDAGAVLHDEARVVGLGSGLGDRGLFHPERMKLAEQVLDDYLAVARRHDLAPWSVRAVATSAARRAMNAATWFQRIQRRLGLTVSVISGDEEARLTWLGATHALAVEDPLLVVDLGGGSTELVLGERRGSTTARSLEIGAVRLTEAFLGVGMVEPAGFSRLRNHVDSCLASFPIEPSPRTVVGVGGTVTTLAATALELTAWDASAVHGYRLTRARLASFIDTLLVADPVQRRALFPVAPDRADFLLAGACCLERTLAHARRQHLVVSIHGLRFGLLDPGT